MPLDPNLTSALENEPPPAGLTIGQLLMHTLSRIDARLDRIETRFDRIDARFDRIDARIDHLETKLDGKVDASVFWAMNGVLLTTVIGFGATIVGILLTR